MGKEEALRKARALVAATRAAQAHGVKHYNKAGRLLTTVLEILTCLKEEGAVTLVRAEEASS